MEPGNYVIRAIEPTGLDAFMTYLEDHSKDNGQNGGILFQPFSRHDTWIGAEKLAAFRAGLETDVGAMNWRRLWAAFDAHGAISGHVDLRGRHEPCTSHRALLGLGVHRDHRTRGLGTRLVENAIQWALAETALEWIDLGFLGGNLPAERLYLRLGFIEQAVIPDMFRIDGQSVSDVAMTKRIRVGPAEGTDGHRVAGTR
jgi:GNAT superfamily N-acetyltransferase